jgi:hypothetical protein
VEAHRIGRGGRGKWAGHGKEVVRWRQVRQTGPSGECGAEEAAGDEASCGTSAGYRRWRGRVGWADGHDDVREETAQRAAGRMDGTSG